MPTGYTSKVCSGKVTEFKDFAIGCIDAFLPDGGRERLEAECSNQKNRAVEKDDPAKQLAIVQAMNGYQCRDAAMTEYAAAVIARDRRRLENVEKRGRYQAMLDKAVAWQPPTKDHLYYKQFMVSQLAESMEHDCDDSYESMLAEPVLHSAENWRQKEIDRLTREAAHDAEWAASAKALAEQRRLFCQQILDTFQ